MNDHVVSEVNFVYVKTKSSPNLNQMLAETKHNHQKCNKALFNIIVEISDGNKYV